LTWTAHTIHFLTQPQLRALFRVITRKRDRTLILVAYRHGLRASELGMLRADELNFAQQRLAIHRVKRSLPGIYSAASGSTTPPCSFPRNGVRRFPAGSSIAR